MEMKYRTDIGILHEVYDELAENPRTMDDGIFSKFYTFLRRSSSPDSCEFSDFRSWKDDFYSAGQAKDIDAYLSNGKTDEAAKAMCDYAFKRGYVLLPVWKYEHGGVRYAASTINPFSCPFDSCLAGVIFCSKEDIYKLFQKRCSPSMVKEMYDMMKAEVEDYSYYANGDVYCYSLEDENGETSEWVGGFYGDINDNGAKDHFGFREYSYIGVA